MVDCKCKFQLECTSYRNNRFKYMLNNSIYNTTCKILVEKFSKYKHEKKINKQTNKIIILIFEILSTRVIKVKQFVS